jgi:protein involved in polysaccharide export with SLBB domain
MQTDLQPAPVMSSDRISEILQQQPELLATIKYVVVQQVKQHATTGTAPSKTDAWEMMDPESITDDAFFSRIEQDADLRIAVSRELMRRGYDEFGEPDSESEQASSAAYSRGLPQERGAEGTESRLSMRERSGAESSQSRLNMREQIGPVPRDRRQLQSPEVREPKVFQRHSPYPTLPSLKDLYSQYPSTETKLKRFGSDTFRYGTGNANNLPMDLPVGPDYVVGPGDGLVLNLWGSVSQRLSRTVDRQGQIALPEAGAITIAGLTIAQAQDAVQKSLGTQFQNIRVEISLGRLRTVRVYVVGDVQRPGAYDISSLSTPLNALYAAGGPTSRGSLRTLRQFRGNQLVREIDLYDFLLHGVRSDVDRLLPGDTLLVPPVGPQVTVSGMVRRPAIYELKSDTSLKEVLDLAGGVLVSASMQQINVERIEAHQRRTMVNVQLSGQPQRQAISDKPEPVALVPQTGPAGMARETGNGKKETGIDLSGATGNGSPAAGNVQLASFRMQDGDRVLVSPILPYNEMAVYLQGHVFRPGKFAYREGLTINDLLRSYQDVMPEPANHAELIRLQPPDFRPVTISLNLQDVLSGNEVINLQPFDVIRIFSRYEIDAPKVTIYGEVLRPGEYPMAQGMTAAGLVRMAGGFKRSAFRDEADLASYVVQNGHQILAKESVVEIGKALDGDTRVDVRLKPGDVLSIRQLAGWKDIGAAVTVSGEVVYAGKYGIAEGERLSSILKRAGGFREEAYPPGAVLERVQVREIAERTRQEMIRRIETTPVNFNPGLATAQDTAATIQAMQQQQQQILASLRNHPASGRQVIRISGNISSWENTPADIEMRAGDVLVIPKRPNFVTVSGQVYNAAAITYTPGRTAEWYLRQAGGPTDTANKKKIFVVRADGSVVGNTGGGWWTGNSLSERLQPGDSIVVPEKIIGSSRLWQNLLGAGQVMATMGLTSAVVLR